MERGEDAVAASTSAVESNASIAAAASAVEGENAVAASAAAVKTDYARIVKYKDACCAAATRVKCD
jgi:head-tail adaptor